MIIGIMIAETISLALLINERRNYNAQLVSCITESSHYEQSFEKMRTDLGALMVDSCKHGAKLACDNLVVNPALVDKITK